MTTERILKRYFPVITCLLIALVAYLQARGLVQLLVLALGGSPERVSSPPPCHDVPPPVATAPKSAEAILERNPFDSMPGPLNSSPPANDAMARLAAPPTISAPPSTPAAPLALLQSVRVVPEQMNGKVVGLRLFGIRPASLLGTLGLKNGDRLESINGFDVTNPEKALEAYARLRTAPHLQLRLVRSGRPLEVDLNII
ncbi:MAG: hypothetical protein ABUL60_30660 [Myxococcales bacterium]